MGDGEDDVKIRNGKKFLLALLQPTFARPVLTFWAVPVTTRIVGVALGAASRAFLEVTAQRCSPTAFQSIKNAGLDSRFADRISANILASFRPNDVSDFQLASQRSLCKRSRGLTVAESLSVDTWRYRVVV